VRARCQQKTSFELVEDGQTAKINFRSHTQSSHDDHQFSGFSLSSTLVRTGPIDLALMVIGSARGRLWEVLSRYLRQVNEQFVTPPVSDPAVYAEPNGQAGYRCRPLKLAARAAPGR
jgi:hypothetical protein